MARFTGRGCLLRAFVKKAWKHQHTRADHDGEIGNVEDPRPQTTDTDIHKINNRPVAKRAVNQVTDPSSDDEANSNDLNGTQSTVQEHNNKHYRQDDARRDNENPESLGSGQV